MDKNEFYGDRVVYRLQKVTQVVSKILYFGGSLFPLILVLSRMFRFTPLMDLDDPDKTGLSNLGFFILLFSPWPISIFIRKLPEIISKLRRSWLYPRDSFTLRGAGKVTDRETKKGRNDSRLHFLTISHPHDPAGVEVQVDEQTYLQVRTGDTLNISYHPLKSGMLYVNVEKVNSF